VAASLAGRGKFVRFVGAKRRSAKKWMKCNLSLYQPGGAYYEEQPPMEPMMAAFLEEFAAEEEDRATYARARRESRRPSPGTSSRAAISSWARGVRAEEEEER
jgi:hypothetical protein